MWAVAGRRSAVTREPVRRRPLCGGQGRASLNGSAPPHARGSLAVWVQGCDLGYLVLIAPDDENTPNSGSARQ